MIYFYAFLRIHLGIVVSALVFYAGGPGSIPGLGKQGLVSATSYFMAALVLMNFESYIHLLLMQLVML